MVVYDPIDKKVTFEYDQNLIDVLNAVSPKVKVLFQDMYEYDNMLAGGLILREHLHKHRNKLTRVNKGGLKNADYLCFGLLYTSDYNRYASWQEFSDDNSHPIRNGRIKENLGACGGGEDWECICGKDDIQNINIHTNKHTGLHCILGSVCIYTGFITTAEERKVHQDAFTKKCDECGCKVKVTSFGKTLACSGCNRRRDKKCVVIEKSAPIHETNDERKINRICLDCHNQVIKPDAPFWKKLCKKCYALTAP